MDRIDPDLLKRYAEGRCTDEESQLVEQWLEEEDNIFAGQHEDAFAQTSCSLHGGVWFVLRWWGVRIGLAGLAVVAIWWGSDLGGRFDAPASDRITHETPAGRRMKITLPDSSTVWLAGGSKLSYPSVFADSLRELSLETGEAYFDVRHNSRHPLRVTTGDAQIDVLGTQFNVNNRGCSSHVRVTLETGSVRFKDAWGTARLLSPGEQLAYQKTAHRVVDVIQVTPGRTAAWREGILWFDATPLTQVLITLENHYGVAFRQEENQRLDMPITGKFDNLPLSKVLRLIEQSTALHFRPSGNAIVVK